MCKASTEPGGPRRCSGDTRSAYGAAGAAVAQLQRCESLLMSQLPVGDTDSPAGDPHQVSFDNKDTRIEDIRREIDAAVDGLNTGDRWKEFLDVSRRFHSYSLNNQMLILLQKQKATRVAGFHKWKEFGRSVNKGERAIWIYAPMIKKIGVDDANGKPKLGSDGKPVKRDALIGFKVVPVYDVSSTSGKALPEPPVIPFNRTSGDAPEGMHDDLREQVEAHGYTLEYRDLGTDSGIPDGATDPRTKKVIINTSYSHAHQGMTLAHELAHIELGHLERTADYHVRAGGQRHTMEVEAESVSYVISRRYGMEPDSSFSYIDGWAMGDKEKVRKTADAVIKATDRILKKITRFN
jgi:hypothetical protein